jgi:hypothetical protein
MSEATLAFRGARVPYQGKIKNVNTYFKFSIHFL